MESLKELWRKEFLPNIRKEICTEIDTLKVSLHDLNKRLDEIEKSQSFISKKYDTVISTITTLKKYDEDVKGQVQQIEEDEIEKSQSSATMVRKKRSSWTNSSSTRGETVSK